MPNVRKKTKMRVRNILWIKRKDAGIFVFENKTYFKNQLKMHLKSTPVFKYFKHSPMHAPFIRKKPSNMSSSEGPSLKFLDLISW
jgi:hypothetical protein